MRYEINWLFLIAVPALLMGLWLSRLLRLAIPLAVLLSLGIDAVTGFFLAMAADSSSHPDSGSLQSYLHDRLNKDDAPLSGIALMVGANLSVALLVKVYVALVLNKATDAERQDGMAGVRAWFSPINVIAVITLSVTAYLGLDYSIVGTLILGFALLLVYPLIGTLTQTPRVVDDTPPQVPAQERQRVLALVEAGKISAEDGAELLSALAQSQATEVDAAAAVTLSPPRRIMLAGAVVVLLGFLLPWFTISTSRAMDAAMNSVQSQIPQFPGGVPNGFVPPQGMQVPTNAVTQLAVHGGDIHDGLGWIILATGLVAAGLPFFWPVRSANAQQHRNVVLCAIGVGTVALLYVLSGSFNAFTSFEAGFIVTIAGYLLLWVGALREYVARRTAPAAVALMP